MDFSNCLAFYIFWPVSWVPYGVPMTEFNFSHNDIGPKHDSLLCKVVKE